MGSPRDRSGSGSNSNNNNDNNVKSKPERSPSFESISAVKTKPTRSPSFLFGRIDPIVEEIDRRLDLVELALQKFKHSIPSEPTQLAENNNNAIEEESVTVTETILNDDEVYSMSFLFHIHLLLISINQNKEYTKALKQNSSLSNRFRSLETSFIITVNDLFSPQAQDQLNKIEDDFKQDRPDIEVCAALEKFILDPFNKYVTVYNYEITQQFSRLYTLVREHLAQQRIEISRKLFSDVTIEDIELFFTKESAILGTTLFQKRFKEWFATLPAEELNSFLESTEHPELSKLFATEFNKLFSSSTPTEKADEEVVSEILIARALRKKITSIFQQAPATEIETFLNDAKVFPNIYHELQSILSFKTELEKMPFQFDIDSAFVSFDILNSDSTEEALLKIARYTSILNKCIQFHDFHGAQIISSGINQGEIQSILGNKNTNLDENTFLTLEKYRKLIEDNNAIHLRTTLETSQQAIPFIGLFYSTKEFLTTNNDQDLTQKLQEENINLLKRLNINAKRLSKDYVGENKWEKTSSVVLDTLKSTESIPNNQTDLISYSKQLDEVCLEGAKRLKEKKHSQETMAQDITEEQKEKMAIALQQKVSKVKRISAFIHLVGEFQKQSDNSKLTFLHETLQFHKARLKQITKDDDTLEKEYQNADKLIKKLSEKLKKKTEKKLKDWDPKTAEELFKTDEELRRLNLLNEQLTDFSKNKSNATPEEIIALLIKIWEDNLTNRTKNIKAKKALGNPSFANIIKDLEKQHEVHEGYLARVKKLQLHINRIQHDKNIADELKFLIEQGISVVLTAVSARKDVIRNPATHIPELKEIQIKLDRAIKDRKLISNKQFRLRDEREYTEDMIAACDDLKSSFTIYTTNLNDKEIQKKIDFYMQLINKTAFDKKLGMIKHCISTAKVAKEDKLVIQALLEKKTQFNEQLRNFQRKNAQSHLLSRDKAILTRGRSDFTLATKKDGRITLAQGKKANSADNLPAELERLANPDMGTISLTDSNGSDKKRLSINEFKFTTPPTTPKSSPKPSPKSPRSPKQKLSKKSQSEILLKNINNNELAVSEKPLSLSSPTKEKNKVVRVRSDLANLPKIESDDDIQTVKLEKQFKKLDKKYKSKSLLPIAPTNSLNEEQPMTATPIQSVVREINTTSATPSNSVVPPNSPLSSPYDSSLEKSVVPSPQQPVVSVSKQTLISDSESSKDSTPTERPISLAATQAESSDSEPLPPIPVEEPSPALPRRGLSVYHGSKTLFGNGSKAYGSDSSTDKSSTDEMKPIGQRRKLERHAAVTDFKPQVEEAAKSSTFIDSLLKNFKTNHPVEEPKAPTNKLRRDKSIERQQLSRQNSFHSIRSISDDDLTKKRELSRKNSTQSINNTFANETSPHHSQSSYEIENNNNNIVNAQPSHSETQVSQPSNTELSASSMPIERRTTRAGIIDYSNKYYGFDQNKEISQMWPQSLSFSQSGKPRIITPNAPEDEKPDTQAVPTRKPSN